uniref:Auxin efflux carrier component n=1 Tax=Zea mays TaxID=4577 RepID=A0A804MPM7_MAIZE
MIGWGDVYKVVAAMAPLYFALGLGYGSVRWWKLFSPDQCDAVNRLVAYFAVPFFAFDFAARIDPFALSYRVLAADALSKLAVALALAAWATAAASASARRGGGGKGKDRALSWCITGFSLATLNNTLVVGVPLLDAMYGKWARDLIVQISVVQIIVYFPALLLALEARRAGKLAVVAEEAAGDADESGGGGSGGGTTAAQSLWPLVTAVWKKVARNPNVYAGILGVSWACVTNRWHIETPSIIEGSVLVMSKTGVGLSMFSMGTYGTSSDRVLYKKEQAVHGAAGEGHRVRRLANRARHGAAVRGRAGRHRRRGRGSRPPRRRPAPRRHAGRAPPVHHHVRVRQGVRPAPGGAEHGVRLSSGRWRRCPCSSSTTLF